MTSSVIGALRIDLGIDSASFTDGLKAAGSKLSSFGAALRSAIVPAAMAGSAALVGVGAAVGGVINNADEMSKAAAKFGVPIETLSRLAYAGELSDVSLSALGTSLGKLSRNMAEAASGSKAQAEAFEAIGVAVTNSDGSLRESSDVLQDLADRFAVMPDGAAKTAAAMELMGRSGTEMIPLLNGGADALREMMAEADTFGQVFTGDMGAQAEQFNDNITRLQGAFGNLAADLTKQLLPYLAQFSDWLVANGPSLAKTAGALIDFGAQIVYVGQHIAEGIKVAGDALVGGTQAVADFVRSAVDGFNQAVAAVQQFGTDLVDGFNRGIEAIRQFGADALAAFQAIPSQVAQVGRDIIDGLLAGLREKWESVTGWVTGAANSIASIFRRETDTHSPSRVFQAIGADIMAGLQLGLEQNQGQVESGMQSFAGRIADTFQDILFEGATFRDAFQGLLSQALGNAGGSLIKSGLGALVGGALGGLSIPLPAYANGTNWHPGGLAVVGERGEEIVNLPRGAQVIPHNEIGDLRGGSGPTTLNVNVTVNGARGNAEITAMVQAGVSAGLGEYDRRLAGRIAQVGRDPFRRNS